MKGFRPYLIFSVVSSAVVWLLSIVFQFSLMNTWQAGVALAVIVGPYLVYGWKMTSKYNDRYLVLCTIIRIIITVFVLGSIIASLAILSE